MLQPHHQHAYAQGDRIFLLPCPCGLTLDQAFRLMCELRDLLPALSMPEPKSLVQRQAARAGEQEYPVALRVGVLVVGLEHGGA
jgi:hypothetical protein